MSNVLIVTYPERTEYPVRSQRLLSRDATERNNNLVGAEPHFIGKYRVPPYSQIRGLSEDSPGTSTPALAAETNTHFVGNYRTPPYWRVRSLSEDCTGLYGPGSQIDAQPHFIGHYKSAIYARLGWVLHKPTDELSSAPLAIETNPHFAGRYTTPLYWRIKPNVEDATGINAPGPPPGGEPHFKGSYKAVLRYVQGVFSQDATGITTQITLPGAESNYIGLYLPPKYSRPINHEDASGISIAAPSLETQPHFVATYKKPPYPVTRFLLHEDATGATVSPLAQETNPYFIGTYRGSTLTRIRGLSEDATGIILLLQPESPVSVIARFQPPVYSRAIQSADVTGISFTLPLVEAPPHFIGQFRSSRYSRPIPYVDALGINASQAAVETNTYFIGRLRSSKYSLPIISADVTGLNAPAQIGVETNTYFIARYRTSKYSIPIPYVDAIFALPFSTPANPHFIGQYRPPSYRRLRGLSEGEPLSAPLPPPPPPSLPPPPPPSPPGAPVIVSCDLVTYLFPGQRIVGIVGIRYFTSIGFDPLGARSFTVSASVLSPTKVSYPVGPHHRLVEIDVILSDGTEMTCVDVL